MYVFVFILNDSLHDKSLLTHYSVHLFVTAKSKVQSLYKIIYHNGHIKTEFGIWHDHCDNFV